MPQINPQKLEIRNMSTLQHTSWLTLKKFHFELFSQRRGGRKKLEWVPFSVKWWNNLGYDLIKDVKFCIKRVEIKFYQIDHASLLKMADSYREKISTRKLLLVHVHPVYSLWNIEEPSGWRKKIYTHKWEKLNKIQISMVTRHFLIKIDSRLYKYRPLISC